MIGHQERVTWMGESVLTLSDLWPSTPRAAIVGLNPAPASVAAGHYYQGNVGQRQLARIRDAGLFSAARDDEFLDDDAVAAGIAFTDIVKRPTRGESDISKAELLEGRARLHNQLRARSIPLVVCVFRQPVVALLGDPGRPGLHEGRTSWGARVFRLPGPFEDRTLASSVMAQLTDALSR